MKIRKATIKDEREVVKLLNEYDKYEYALDKRYKPDTIKDVKELFNKIIKSKRGIILVLEINNNIEGIISGEWNFNLMGKSSQIHQLIISKKYRKEGYGKKLLKALEDHFKKIGCKSIKSFVLIKNKKALPFYKKLNYSFKEEGYIIKKKLK